MKNVNYVLPSTCLETCFCAYDGDDWNVGETNVLKNVLFCFHEDIDEGYPEQKNVYDFC